MSRVASSDPNSLNRFTNIAAQVEEKIFRYATTKDVYLKGICKKMALMDNSSSSIVASSSSQGTEFSEADATGDSSRLQNVPEFAHNVMGNSVDQLQPIIATTKSEMSSSQPLQLVVSQPDQPQQLQNHHLQRLYNNHLPQKQQSVSQKIQQHMQQKISSQQLHQQLPQQQSSATLSNWNQQFTEQINTLEQQQNSLSQGYKSNTFQQPYGLPSNVSGALQLQKVVAPQSNVLKLLSHQPPTPMLRPVEVTAAQHEVPQTSQSTQFHQLQGSPMKLNLSEENMPQMLQTSAVLFKSQNVIDQQKQIQSQRVLHEVSTASLGSSAPNELTNVATWYDWAYQKLQSVRENCLEDLERLQKTAVDMFQQAQNPENFKKSIISIGKMITFLKLPRSDIVRFSEQKFQGYLQAILLFVYHSNMKNKNSAPAQQQAQQLQFSGCKSQPSQLQHNKNVRPHFHPEKLPSRSTPIGISPLSEIEQGFPNSQPTMINSLQSGSQVRLEKRNVFSPLQHDYPTPVHQAITGSSKQKKFSHNSSLNTLDSTINSFQKSSTIIAFQQQKQHKIHQTMQPQNLTQVFTEDAQPSISSGFLQHCHSIDSEHPDQTQPPRNPVQFHSTSQIYQSSSLQVSQQNLGSPLSKAGTVFPSATPVDLEKRPSSVSVLSNSDCNQQTAAPKQPLKRLLKAVESVSQKALSASVQEIDMIAGTTIDNVSKGSVGGGLACRMICQIKARNYRLQNRHVFADKVKHQINYMAHKATLLSANEICSFKRLADDLSDLDSTARYQIKRPRIEPKNELQNEIKCINQQLVETMIDLDSTEDLASTVTGEGTVIRCSYSAVALSQNLKLLYASSHILPVLSLWLLVPADYPNSSPTIFDGMTVRWSHDNKESKELSENAKLKFSIVLRILSEPMSLGEMARTWEFCAREVFLENAQHIGGECFSSRYGRWENCITG
ncbi:mediator of rna polymerase ii transcription subunit 15a [Quercus suber]|uniref:Mediator of rna polymerase ii transcription subunit 15a n=2 Tax=Quercus suber TaxID=58331 RepID=A0AAW0JVT1_QUESU